MNTCIRVYANGDRKISHWNDKETEEWLEYNRVARFGNALFVNGVCKQQGYLSEEECSRLEQEFHGNMAQA